MNRNTDPTRLREVPVARAAIEDLPLWNRPDIRENIELLKPQDRDFLGRVLGKGIDVYHLRLEAIKFTNMERVLDAGCGFGQWTAPLAMLNKEAVGVDFDPLRVSLARKLWKEHPSTNFLGGNLQQLPFRDESFDAIFCYSVIYFTDPLKTLKEFHRVLRPGGKVYICTNGWGWFFYNFLERRNASLDFDPRKYALQTTIRTLWYYMTGRFMGGRAIVTPSTYMRRILRKAGFSIIALQGEGTINFANVPITPNYKPCYKGLENVYELVAIKQ